jgi:hypothetical protein
MIRKNTDTAVKKAAIASPKRIVFFAEYGL